MERWHRLGIVSDLHCLSQYGLVPPRWWPQGGVTAMPAVKFMEFLWERWEAFCRAVGPLDCLIINGDIIEGESPSKRDAMDAITDNLTAQQQAAEETIGMLVKAARPKTVWLIRGTPYHEGRHFECIEAVGRAIGAEQWTPGRYTGYVLEGTWRGLSINATHHMTTGAIYMGTLASRTALFSTAAETLGKANHADLIIRSHLHVKNVQKSFGRWVIQTPAWKLVTPYAIKKMEFNRAVLLSDLGSIVVETDGHGKVLIDDETFAYPTFRSALRNLEAAGDGPEGADDARPKRAGRGARGDAGAPRRGRAQHRRTL